MTVAGWIEDMPETTMAANLATLYRAIAADPGLRASISTAQINRGLDAAAGLNSVLLQMIAQTRVNADGRITPADMQAISDALWLDSNAAPWRDFWLAHGNDNGDVVSGFHWVQNDGATLLFQGRNFVDTVADAIYHYGFRIANGRYYNEDGNDNEQTADVAGWLNYFLNGENIVYGTGAADVLGTGTYSAYFAAARNETFLAGNGNDRIWAGDGNDKVYAGAGNDVSGGGTGADRMFGEDGHDTLWGDTGNDTIDGGAGNDEIGGAEGNDSLGGGGWNDVIYGEEGNDTIDGGAGADQMNGGDGNDRIEGGSGNDALHGSDGIDILRGEDGNDDLSGGNGADHLSGGRGADTIQLWEQMDARDTLYFAPGDSGRTAETIDTVEGFDSGIDKINLASFGAMTFERLDFRAGGHASCYYDGTLLRIDGNGDGATDMMVAFAWVEELRAGDFIFA